MNPLPHSIMLKVNRITIRYCFEGEGGESVILTRENNMNSIKVIGGRKDEFADNLSLIVGSYLRINRSFLPTLCSKP